MSIHGICFDEGQAGNCGPECRGFLEGECTIVDEIMWECREELLPEYMGVLRYNTLKVAGRLDEMAECKKITEDFGYPTDD